ncbi:MAG: hypothetical protein ACYC3G_02125 [Minisyncoccota bacterium]
MNEELLKLRRTLVLSSLMILVGGVDLALFVFKGIKIIHPFLGLVLIVAGFFIFKAAFKKDDKKIEEPKKDVHDGWEYLGEGCYCQARAREDRDEEIKRKAEYEAYMKSHFPNKKKEENK